MILSYNYKILTPDKHILEHVQKVLLINGYEWESGFKKTYDIAFYIVFRSTGKITRGFKMDSGFNKVNDCTEITYDEFLRFFKEDKIKFENNLLIKCL